MNEQYNPFLDDGQNNEYQQPEQPGLKQEPENQEPDNQETNNQEPNNQELTAEKVVNPWFERVKGVGIIVIFLLTQTLGSIIFGVLLGLDGRAEELKNLDNISQLDGLLTYLFTGTVIAEGLLLLCLAIYYRKAIVVKCKETFSQFGKFFVKILLYFGLLLFITSIIGRLDLALFPQYANNAGDNQALIEEALSTPTLAMILSICVTAPFIEEFVFRYGLIKKLLYGMNKYVAAIVAALIFSFAHIGFGQTADLSMFVHLMLGYIGQALVFGIIYVREDNLIYPIVIHFLNNTQAVVIITLLSAS